MSDDDAPSGDLRSHLAAGSRRCIRTTSRGTRSAATPARQISRGSGITSATAGWPAMKAGIEAGDLRHVRQAVPRPLRLPPDYTADAEGRAESASADSARTCGVTTVGPVESRAAMNDAVADAKHVCAAVPGAQPGGQGIERTADIAHCRLIQRLIGRFRSPEPSLAENRGDVPMPSIWPRDSSSPGLRFRPVIHAELQAG